MNNLNDGCEIVGAILIQYLFITTHQKIQRKQINPNMVFQNICANYNQKKQKGGGVTHD